MAGTQKSLSMIQLTRLFDQCEPDQQQLLRLLAVIYQPVAVSRLYACLNKLGMKDAGKKPYTQKKLKQILETLTRQGLLEGFGARFAIHQRIAEILSRQLFVRGEFESMSTVVRAEFPLGEGWSDPYMLSARQGLSEIRMQFYAARQDQVNRLLNEYEERFQVDFQHQNPLYTICFEPFDSDWFSQLPVVSLGLAINETFNQNSRDFSSMQGLLEWILNAFQEGRLVQSEGIAFICASQFLLHGDLASAQLMSAYVDDYYRLLLTAWQQFMQGENSLSLDNFAQALERYKKITRKRKIFLGNISGIFYLLALIKSANAEQLSLAHDYSNTHSKQKRHSNPACHRVLSLLLKHLCTGSPAGLVIAREYKWQSFNSTLAFLLYACYQYWTDKEQALKLIPELKKFATAAEKSNSLWLAAEAWQLLARLLDDSQYEKLAHQQHALQHTQSLIDIIRPKQKWEQALDAIAMMRADQTPSTTDSETRLVWMLSGLEKGYPYIQPKEQKRTASGRWSKGRNVSLKRLMEEPDSYTGLCEQDRNVQRAIHLERSYGYYGGASYEIDEYPALLALAGHPYLFDAEFPERQIELIAAEPEVLIRKQGAQLLISMLPERMAAEIVLVRETALRWKVISLNAQHRQLSELIGEGLSIPAEHKSRVLDAMSSIAPLVNIHSDIGGELESLQTVEADSSLHILLSPAEEGLSIEARSRVFGQCGPYFYPAQGSENLIAEIDGKRLQTKRDLKQERSHFDKFIEACPLLSPLQNEDFLYAISDPEECLEVLSELQAYQEQVTIAWPKGESMRIRQQVSLSQFRLQIDAKNDWFSASGELQLEDGQLLNMQRLLALSQQARGRFIQLEDGQFLALSKTFHKRLQELNRFGEVQADAVKLHPLAALTLEDMAAEVGQLKAAKHWKQFSQRFEQAMALQPKLPGTLQAELRDYQLQGFEWLVRLAQWGAGACLADDMGLGKTLQALALILYRAMNGPSLVVAPTSVSLNWMDEIQRFAPTLNIIDIRDPSLPAEIKFQAFDLVISSYGLLQTRADQLQQIDWQTIVLDEAQAIKNPATKRSQAAMKLNGQFKCITTGTPIENHLGELWNLFRFINPGLLGSLERFNERFALPISRDANPQASQQLKKLIQPFILRRSKSQVLKELPARTEIVLSIEMSQDEARLYESMRREAIQKLSGAAEDGQKGHRQLQILAEITRLRQACCNPQLVMKQGAPASSKLAQFAETLDELLENHHKALVFSQFVGHLKIIEQYLIDKGISYQYLDGSTPVQQRSIRVKAFQAGIGDVFLISLKAGGVGLNLTAADYVIHMDPWWNPAVEDQASDRAHRIGQTRPVTVYRMVMKDSIEQKIIALHLQKRDLADNLLAGTDVADKLNADDLLALLKQE